jgi:hypothetical protein
MPVYVIVTDNEDDEHTLLQNFVEAVNTKQYDKAMNILWELAISLPNHRARYYCRWYDRCIRCKENLQDPRHYHAALEECARECSSRIA